MKQSRSILWGGKRIFMYKMCKLCLEFYDPPCYISIPSLWASFFLSDRHKSTLFNQTFFAVLQNAYTGLFYSGDKKRLLPSLFRIILITATSCKLFQMKLKRNCFYFSPQYIITNWVESESGLCQIYRWENIFFFYLLMLVTCWNTNK